jgi:hypothetical protein
MLRYFLDLGFFHEYEDLDLGPNVIRRRLAWTLSVYVMTSLGILFRQYTDFPKVATDFGSLRWSVVLGSFVIGLALLPLPMYWFNRRKKRGSQPNWEQVLLAFSFGFFVDLSGQQLAASVLRLVQAGRP